MVNLPKLTSIQLVMALRSVSIVVQTCLVLFVVMALSYELPVEYMMAVILAEVVFNVAWYVYYQRGNAEQKSHLVLQLIGDVIFLGWLLYFSGGATNAFVSLLLIPIAIAAVSLHLKGLAFVALTAIATYSWLLWLMPMHVMHGNMEAHFIGMWMNFLLSAVVVSVVVNQMALIIRRRELTIAQFREEQLKQERIIALGVASAQVTHDLATPIASLQLMVDELKDESNIEPELMQGIEQQLARCSEKLHAFRQMSEDIKVNKRVEYSAKQLFNQIIRHCQLNYPHVDFRFSVQCETTASNIVKADGSLIPAIVNVINNAVIASGELESNQVDIISSEVNSQWQLSIRDFGKGFDTGQFIQLGNVPQPSEQGFGMAILLSNSSLERLGGALKLTNHQQGGAEVVMTLPLVQSQSHNAVKKELP